MSLFVTCDEAISLRLLGNDDILQRAKGRLKKFSKYVWQDLNLSTVKKAVRKRYKIDKRTRTIDLPCNALQLSSVNVLDKCGIEYPVYRNNRILSNDDLVDVGETKNCGCEFNCNSTLCNTVKGYEAVISTKEDKNPNGSTASFECVDRKGVDGQGFFYEQLQYPERVYVDGVWTQTVLKTETRKLCKVEVDENGCICDTEANLDLLCNACGIGAMNTNLCCIGGTAETPPSESCSQWIYYCNSKLDWFSIQCGGFPYFRSRECENIYNITELGDRLIFPANFGHDEVIVRWYEDLSGKDIQIPVIAIDTFIVGLMWWDCRFNDKKQNLADKYKVDYATLKFGLLKELNKYRIAELCMIMAPPKYIPSYTTGRSNQYESSRAAYWQYY